MPLSFSVSKPDKEKRQLYVIKDDKNVVAHAATRQTPLKEIRFSDLYVDPAYRRKGLAEQIIKEVKLKNRGKTITLRARPFGQKGPSLEDLKEFYRRQGFEDESKAEDRMIIKKAADPITGIPDRTRFGKTEDIPTAQALRLVLQRHTARRSGEHTDIRMGPQTGLHWSWATKKGPLPRPGEKLMWFQQPLHCFPPNVLVHTEQGALEIGQIVDNRLPLNVGSTDSAGNLVYRKVTNYWKRPANDPLVILSVAIPFKNSAHLRCTKGHVLFSKGAHVQAGNVRVGDYLDFVLDTPNSDQAQILWGSLLGDGSVDKNGKYRFGHSDIARPYFEWKSAALAPFFSTLEEPYNKKHKRYSKNTFLVASSCSNHPWFVPLRGLYSSGKKEVTSAFLSKLGALALAVWYQDDGCILNSGTQFHGCCFCTHGFSTSSVQALQDWLLTSFGLTSYTVARGAGQLEIRLSTVNAARLFELIAPFVHQSMAYKLTLPVGWHAAPCVNCGQSINSKYRICDQCLLLDVSKFDNSARYREAYYSGATLVSPKLVQLRCGTWAQAKAGHIKCSSHAVTVPTFDCGTALVGLNIAPVRRSWPVRVAVVRPSAMRSNEKFLYDLEVEDTHKYLAGSGFVVSNSAGYADFEGELKNGYGAGTVRKAGDEKISVTEATPDKIRFTVISKGDPEYYTLVRSDYGPQAPKTERERYSQGGGWLIINTTPTSAASFLGIEPAKMAKMKYKRVPSEEVDKLFQQGNIVQNKIDGASMLYKLFKDRIEATSYRTDISGKPIIHTQRLFGLGGAKAELPPDLEGTVLRGEAYGVRGTDGKAIPPQELGGLLNSSVMKSLAKQQAGQVQMKNMLFDVVGDEDKPYAERLRKLQRVAESLPKDRFHLPESATSPEEQKKLWETIRTGKHPLTSEGVVVWPDKGNPIKVKVTPESDVWIKNVFKGEGRLANSAGGFEYSTSPEGEVVGRVGTGLTDDTRREMAQNPDKWLGRMARIRSQGQFPSGAHRAPTFIARHEDYAPVKQAAADLMPYRDRSELIGRRDGKVVAMEYPHKGIGFYGGGIEEGEDPSEAAAREFFEESGLKATNVRPVGIDPVPLEWTNEMTAENPVLAEKAKKWRGSRTHYFVGDVASRRRVHKQDLDSKNPATSRFVWLTPEEAIARLTKGREGAFEDSKLMNAQFEPINQARIAALKQLLKQHEDNLSKVEGA